MLLMDLCSKRIVNHSVSEHITQNLVLSPIEQAVSSRKRKQGQIFHNDQGTQYIPTAGQVLLAKLGFMSGKGSFYDHAVIESFWHTLKRGYIQDQSV